MRENFPNGFASESRVAVIGDIHGRPDVLQAALDSVSSPSETEVILLGDYIDRGPSSLGVLKILNDLAASSPFRNLIMLPGNHDGMVWAGANGCRVSYETWLLNGGETVAAREFPLEPVRNALEGLAASLPAQVKLRLAGKMPAWHQNGNLLFVHAGVHPLGGNEKFLTQPYFAPRAPYWEDESWAWIRFPFLHHEDGFTGPGGEPVFVVHGHARLRGAFEDELKQSAMETLFLHRMGLDTSGTGGALLLEAEGGEFELHFVHPAPEIGFQP